jgi:hypothetical protein
MALLRKLRQVKMNNNNSGIASGSRIGDAMLLAEKVDEAGHSDTPSSSTITADSRASGSTDDDLEPTPPGDIGSVVSKETHVSEPLPRKHALYFWGPITFLVSEM